MLPETLSHTPDNRPCTIFLAEDDIDDQELLHEALASLNARIKLISFTTGVKFMNHIAEMEDSLLPDLIILDYNIPEINGAEILKQLGKHHRFDSIPKIVWSTSDSHLFRQTCLDLGARSYLVKPSSIGGIQHIAKKMLEHC